MIAHANSAAISLVLLIVFLPIDLLLDQHFCVCLCLFPVILTFSQLRQMATHPKTGSALNIK